MGRHVKSCKAAPAVAHRQGGPSFHVFIEGRYHKAYWLHVAVPVRAHLSKLDNFLRRIWVECCQHPSMFSIGPMVYVASPMVARIDSHMQVACVDVLGVGAGFAYEYDSTKLALKVVGLREQGTRGGEVELLARNEPPQYPCNACGSGKPAIRICTNCCVSTGGWLCEDCVARHGEPEFLLPVLNSPRAGMCVYGNA